MADPVEYMTDDDFDLVRGQIDITLDEDALPDSIIQQDTYLKAANLYVNKQTNNHANNDQLRLAAVYRCAALLVPAVRDLKRETDVGVTTEFADRDLKKIEAGLYARSDEAIRLGIDDAAAARREPFTLFTSTRLP